MVFVVMHLGFIGGIFSDNEKAQFLADLLRKMYGNSEGLANVFVTAVPLDRPLLNLPNELFNEWEDKFPETIPPF